jgi:hypothetical protein
VPGICPTGTVTELIKVQITHVKAVFQQFEALAYSRVAIMGGFDTFIHSRARLVYRESKKLYWVPVLRVQDKKCTYIVLLHITA